MPKSSFFTGQPILSQLLNLIPKAELRRLVRQHRGDRYCKRFKTSDHLVTMLYACFHHCESLREIMVGMHAHHHKLGQLGLQCAPSRSTLSDANQRRPVAIFEQLYHALYKRYYRSLPDSRLDRGLEDRLFIMDSTTITLFTDIMKGAGCPAADGRKKGGAKAHVLLDARNDIPSLIRLTESARNDRIFMKDILLPKGSILVFDKGYHHFAQWQQWTGLGINWVTRLIDTEKVAVLESLPLSGKYQQAGVLADQRIRLGRGTTKSTTPINVRLITYKDSTTGRIFRFLSNNFKFSPLTVAEIYRQRWQIELFFKRFKKHNPLRLFLGNSENAIKIQLWCSFIAELLIKIVKDRSKKNWSFANLSALIRQNLMTYLQIMRFLNHPQGLIAPQKTYKANTLFT
jgi:hypothetical protein